MRLKILVQAMLLPISIGMCQATYGLTSQELNKQLETYKSKIEKLEKQIKKNKRYNRSDTRGLKKLWDSFSANGFMSVGAVKSDEDVSYQGIDDKLSFSADSVLGLQFSFNLTDDVSATTQLVSPLGADPEAQVEWAYLTFHINDDLAFRAGRLRLTTYMNSEYLDVGYAYPWARPPFEVYNLPIKGYEGADMLYRFELQDWSALFQLGFGNTKVIEPVNRINYDVEDGWNISLFLSRGPFSFRAGYATGNVDFIIGADTNPAIPLADVALKGSLAEGGLGVGLPQGFLEDDVSGGYTSFGLQYDDSRWLVIAEATQFRLDRSLIPSSEAQYVTVGRRFGKAMPYTSWSTVRRTGGTLKTLNNAINAVTGFKAATQSQLENDFPVLLDQLVGLQTAIALEEQGGVLPPVELPAMGSCPATTALSANDISQYVGCVLEPLDAGAAAIMYSQPDVGDVGLLIEGFNGQLAAGFEQLAQVDGLVDVLNLQKGSQSSWSLGLRYELSRKMSMKTEFQRVYDIQNGGLTDSVDVSQGLNMFTVVFDAVW